MPRARFSTGWGIRRDRKAQRGSGAGGTGAQTFADILGANLLVEFDARFLSSAGSWTDRRRGIAMGKPAGAATPAYAADGVYFNGLPVHQCAITGGAALFAPPPAQPVYPAGSRPYICGVMRLRNGIHSATTNLAMRVLTADQSANVAVIHSIAGAPPLLQVFVNQVGASGLSSIPSSTAVHFIEYWMDAAGVVRFAMDGVELATSTPGSPLPMDSGYIQLGGSHVLNQFVSDTSHALYLCCQSVPTDTQRAQILALAKSIWFPPQTPPLPASAVEYWHSELGASVANAVGQIAGTTLPGIGGPTVAVDPGFFNGRTVYQSFTTGGKAWANNALAALAAAGARPYQCAVLRTRTLGTLPTGIVTAIAMRGGDFSPTGDLTALAFEGTLGVDSFVGYRNRDSVQSRAISGDIQDLVPHFFELYTDAALGLLLYMDGVQIAANATATAGLSTAITKLGLGCLHSGGGAGAASNFSDTSLAFWMICSAAPSAAERTALRAWAQAYWGVP